MVKPIGSNAQRQRMVVTLKNICRDYPAGGTVLRELLQNADDAGATVVRFVLDERSYSTSNVVDEQLRQYQGPALLAYNNAEFTEKDLENLKHTGDSYKLDDGSTTGRFGRGFNSVYHWTDSPSIVSRNRLLILDPHERWSTDIGVSPLYDFVAERDDPDMRGQMLPFQQLHQDTTQPLDGTIIRIPLRTTQQAKDSEIVDCAVTLEEIRDILERFATEFADSGLLFMRNVEQVSLEMSNKTSKIRLENAEEVRRARILIKNALREASQLTADAFSHSFNMEIMFTSAGRPKLSSYAVHHHIGGSPIVENLATWAKKEKVAPWVAIAAPLQPSENISGRYFTVLPLPITSAQPVHIHGMFSISPDRARLYLKDSNTYNPLPADWNLFLAYELIPKAWANLLLFISNQSSADLTFRLWPTPSDDPQNLLWNVTEKVIEILIEQSLAVFPTDIGYRQASSTLLDTGIESDDLKSALAGARLPVIYAPSRLRKSLEHLIDQHSPKGICRFLQNQEIRLWDVTTKRKILEYLISEGETSHFEDLELVPFEDDTHRALSGHSSFIHQDELEKEIFCLEASQNVDLESVSVKTKRLLMDMCRNAPAHAVIRHRTKKDFADYCERKLFQEDETGKDVIPGEHLTDVFPKLWQWISAHVKSIGDKEIAGLCLLPLSNGLFRRLKPETGSAVMILRGKAIDDVVRRMDKNGSSNAPPLLNLEVMGMKPTNALLGNTDTNTALSLWDADNPSHLLQWLSANSAQVATATDGQKETILEYLAGQFNDANFNENMLGTMSDSLQVLKIFKKVLWEEQDGKHDLTSSWTCLNATPNSVLLLDGLTPCLDSLKCQYLIADSKGFTKQILDALNLSSVKKCNTNKLIERHILPEFEQSDNVALVKIKVSKFLLRSYASMSKASQTRLPRLGFIPVVMVSQYLERNNSSDGSSSPVVSPSTTSTDGTVHEIQFAAPSATIDPDASDLLNLFFKEEEVVPEPEFYEEFAGPLKFCGMKTQLDPELVRQRVEAYSTGSRPIAEVETRNRNLLQSYCRTKSSVFVPELRNTPWLALKDTTGEFKLESPSKCRPLEDQLIVGLVCLILPYTISPSWVSALGWKKQVGYEILLQQLRAGVKQNNPLVVDQVLQYISKTEQLARAQPSLEHESFVWSDGGSFLLPQASFFTMSEDMLPYAGVVDRHFKEKHKELLEKCGVRDEPCIDDLLVVQTKLKAKCPLDDLDARVAINIMTMGAKFGKKAQVGLNILGADGNLYEPHDAIYTNVSKLTVSNRQPTHPGITMSLAQSLGVELLSEQHKKAILNIEDKDDDDEFDQKEQVTNRISDTLERYPIESTFREYLANAEDARATKICWLLDERAHVVDGLLTPELGIFQGPALMVYNDSVFSEADLQGFKNVGEGSKRENATVIGQFGRGSQTMFHWTDVPMVLSGNFLIILDPQQNVLPMNWSKGQRKPGVKLLLSAIHQTCPAQLAPFDKLWEFDMDLDYYSGTIFRFPLRTSATKLSAAKKYIDVDATRQLLASYLEEARISLLFLNHVRSIDFSISGMPGSEWSVKKQIADQDDNGPSHWITCAFSARENKFKSSGTDKWRITRSIVKPPHKQVLHGHSRILKNVECAVAALISTTPHAHASDEERASINKPTPRVFSTLPLPLPFKSDLPIHVHATFSLSGDRQSLVVEEHGGIQNSSWNAYFLKEALPDCYLLCLEDLAHVAYDQAMDFWPQIMCKAGEFPRQIVESLQQKLVSSPQRVFMKARAPNEKWWKPSLLTFQEAVFNLDDPIDRLLPLFLSLDLPLVVDLPLGLRWYLNHVQAGTHLTESSIRKLFKTVHSRDLLRKEISHDPKVMPDLLGLAIASKENPEELDGCFLLQLANGDIGALKFNPDASATQYYHATDEQVRMFDFASDILVPVSNWKHISKCVTENDFNVKALQLGHFTKLLQKKSASSEPHSRQWLEEFWKYWNLHAWASPEAQLGDAVVFNASCDGVSSNMKASDLDSRPSIVQPSVKAEATLCAKFPGLYIFDRLFMPNLLRIDEDCLSKGLSFSRFIKSIHKLCPADIAFGDFIVSVLDMDDLVILRELVIKHSGRKDDEANLFEKVIDVVRSVPLWQSCDPTSTRLLSAQDVLIIQGDVKNTFLMPWMKNYNLFTNDINYLPVLERLGAKTISPLVAFESHILPLPSFQSEDAPNWRHFQKLIKGLDKLRGDDAFRSAVFRLRSRPMAPNGSLDLCITGSLYDHTDPIFLAAFRTEQHLRFVHESLRGYRTFWLSLGLCQNRGNALEPKGYVECLRSLNSRTDLSIHSRDADIGADCDRIVAPLGRLGTTQYFHNNDWIQVSNYKVFNARTNLQSEPDYRRSAMATVAMGQPLIKLSEIVADRHISVCWSQTSFPVIQPTGEVLSHFKSGVPSSLMVWRHLLHLKEMTQYLKPAHIRHFLNDLYDTYKHLQSHDLQDIPLEARKDAVWLNLASFDSDQVDANHVKTEWVSAQHLVLSSTCDAGPIKAVKAGLMRFENLLRLMDCNVVSYPTVVRPELLESHSILGGLRALKDQEKLLDVYYHTEGQIVKAHRLVLAACSDKCAAQFGPEWVQASPDIDAKGILNIKYEKFDENGDLNTDFLTYHALSTMINYAYDNTVDWSDMEVRDEDDSDLKDLKLQKLMDLLKAADCWLVRALKSQVEAKILQAGKKLITIKNVVQIKQGAAMFNAPSLEGYCREFKRSNRLVLEKLALKEEHEESEGEAEED